MGELPESSENLAVKRRARRKVQVVKRPGAAQGAQQLSPPKKKCL
jgi:hypothetical protein